MTLIQLARLQLRLISALECPPPHQEVSTQPLRLRFNNPHLLVPIMGQQLHRLPGLTPNLSLPVSRSSRPLSQI